jgi:hypothetical protein
LRWQAFKPGKVRIEISEVETMKLGKFIELWKKVDSAWLLHRHMWSSNALPPPLPNMPPN